MHWVDAKKEVPEEWETVMIYARLPYAKQFMILHDAMWNPEDKEYMWDTNLMEVSHFCRYEEPE